MKPRIYIHRINSVKELKKIPRRYGVEVDIRAYGKDLVLNHEPYCSGDELGDYLKEFEHDGIILNIKEAGIENDVISMCEEIMSHNKSFLLDVEFPYITQSIYNQFKNIAIRFSENEPIGLAKELVGKFDWLWIDTVTKLPIKVEHLDVLKSYKTCLVCPERWSRPSDITLYFKKFNEISYYPNSIMTSKECLPLWESLYEQNF